VREIDLYFQTGLFYESGWRNGRSVPVTALIMKLDYQKI
jgi:hypothetical protein